MRIKQYRDVSDLFGSMFDDAFEALGAWNSYEPPRINKIISSNSFPPTNISIDSKTKVMIIQSALAGIHEDWINLSFDGDHLKLVVDVPECDEKKDESPYYLQQGLKKVKHFETNWTVDPRFYSREDVNVTFDNGLLVIKIFPREDVKPKQIKLFGNLEPKQVEDKKEE